MGNINASVDLRPAGEIAVVTIDNPPVNALKHEVRAGLAEALRQAKRHLLQQPGYPHPFYWAAFIPAGDWRPLDATDFLPQRSTP